MDRIDTGCCVVLDLTNARRQRAGNVLWVGHWLRPCHADASLWVYPAGERGANGTWQMHCKGRAVCEALISMASPAARLAQSMQASDDASPSMGCFVSPGVGNVVVPSRARACEAG
ncbi:hypothetical protein PMIN03_009201 [Paraphaeosphaeria minitans]